MEMAQGIGRNQLMNLKFVINFSQFVVCKLNFVAGQPAQTFQVFIAVHESIHIQTDGLHSI